jgi:hypothetical protein
MLGQYDLETPDKLVRLLVTIARNKVAHQANKEHAARRDQRRINPAAVVGDCPAPGGSPSRQIAARELMVEARKRMTEVIREIGRGGMGVVYLAWQSGLNRLVAVIAQLWDLTDNTTPGAIMRHPGAVKTVGFSSDGLVTLTVSWDQVRLWDAETGELLGAPLPHVKEILEASFSPDGKAILTRGRDSAVRVWSTAPVRAGARRLRHKGWVTAVAFHPQGGESFLTGIGGSEAKVLSWSSTSLAQDRSRWPPLWYWIPRQWPRHCGLRPGSCSGESSMM